MKDFLVISQGKLKVKEPHWQAALADFEKRVNAFPNTRIRFISVKDESEFAEKIPPNSFVFALCIEGIQLSSEKFADKLNEIYLSEKKAVCFLIGDSDGLSEPLKNSANLKLSLSEMTFVHRLARIMLAEQIYRALTIQNKLKYHK